MTTKTTAKKYHIHVGGRDKAQAAAQATAAQPAQPAQAPQQAAQAQSAASQAARVQPAAAPEAAGQNDVQAQLEAIRQEGLTGRQLRTARRLAQRNGLKVTSDYDAVRQLRAKGINPLEQGGILDFASSKTAGKQAAPQQAPAQGEAAANLPQPVGKPAASVPQVVQPKSTELGPLKKETPPAAPSPSKDKLDEIKEIQRNLVRRRRRNTFLMFARLAVFVLLPTAIAGYYFYKMATPMYATNSEFVIQQAEAPGALASGMSGMLTGTPMATQTDSITVQSYLTSRAAMLRLDEEEGFKAHFSQDFIDPIQRLPEDASNEEAYKVYEDRVKISYDLTEGIIKMEVIAADPQTSQRFSEALVGYAEEQVDALTARLRNDQMRGAEESYAEAEAQRQAALEELKTAQIGAASLDPMSQGTAVQSRISALEAELDFAKIELQSLLSNARPNAARVQGTELRIQLLENQIAALRGEITQASGSERSVAETTAELRQAEENYQFQIALVQQAMTARETARLEAERQVRYLSVGVEPVAPDEASYPKAFENTLVAGAIFAGIYLMLSLTAAVLREQVSS